VENVHHGWCCPVPTPKYDITLSILLIQEDGGWWSAQCLEYDIAAQAKNLTDLLYEIDKALVAHIAVNEEAGIDPFAGLPAAPQQYWELFYNAKLNVSGTRAPFRAPLPFQHRVHDLQFRVAEKRV
jgi:hypothetical protein